MTAFSAIERQLMTQLYNVLGGNTMGAYGNMTSPAFGCSQMPMFGGMGMYDLNADPFSQMENYFGAMMGQMGQQPPAGAVVQPAVPKAPATDWFAAFTQERSPSRILVHKTDHNGPWTVNKRQQYQNVFNTGKASTLTINGTNGNNHIYTHTDSQKTKISGGDGKDVVTLYTKPGESDDLSSVEQVDIKSDVEKVRLILADGQTLEKAKVTWSWLGGKQKYNVLDANGNVVKTIKMSSGEENDEFRLVVMNEKEDGAQKILQALQEKGILEQNGSDAKKSDNNFLIRGIKSFLGMLRKPELDEKQRATKSEKPAETQPEETQPEDYIRAGFTTMRPLHNLEN